MALEKNIGKNETIELFDDKSLYKFVKKGKLKRKNSFDRASIDGSEYLYGLRTSHSICTSVESSNSNEIKKKFSSLKTNIIGEKLEETLDEKNELILSKFKSSTDKFIQILEIDIKKQIEKFEKRKNLRQVKQSLIKSILNYNS